MSFGVRAIGNFSG